MRDLIRNKRQIYYAPLIGTEVVYDEDGNETGETRPVYGDVVLLHCNVSAAVGEDAVNAFGSFTNYSRTISISDIACPMDEGSVVWFGVSTSEPYNYIVTRKADSKNALLYAIQEVSVTT